MPHPQSLPRRRAGFTLAEISVTLFLLSLMVVMTVSFSQLVGRSVTAMQGQYLFLEQCDSLREDVTAFVQENTALEAHGSVLSAQGCTFSGHFSEISSVEFTICGRLLKCTATGADGAEQSFVVALRVADAIGGNGP